MSSTPVLPGQILTVVLFSDLTTPGGSVASIAIAPSAIT